VFRKRIVPVALAGVLAGGVIAGTTAYAATPATATGPTAAAATGNHVRGGHDHLALRTHRRELRRLGVTIAAETIGITHHDLVGELRSGKSIAQVAAEHNVTTQTVVTALTTAADAKINQAVTDHKLTSARATTIEAGLPNRLDKLVNRVF